MIPRMRACKVLAREPARRVSGAEHGLEHLQEHPVGSLDGNRGRADSHVRDQRRRVLDRACRRETGRHQHAVHALRSDGVGCDGCHERGVDAARQAHEHFGEPVLANVVGGTEHERLVDLSHAIQAGRDGCEGRDLLFGTRGLFIFNDRSLRDRHQRQ